MRAQGFLQRVLLSGLLVTAPGMLCAQSYPTKPVRIVTGGTGGVLDTTARVIGQALTEKWGQQVVIDNRPSGLIPAEMVAKARPDGYTLLLSGVSLWIEPLLQKVPYDLWRDFAPVTLAVSAPNVLVVHPSLPVKSVQELIALARAKPGELNYASGQLGTSVHMAPELLKYMADIDMVRISYKSSGAGVNALIAGEVQLMFATAAGALPHLKSGRLRAVAVTTAKPTALLPGLPTMAASGLPGYEMGGAGNGIFAPARTPPSLINALNAEIVRVLSRPDIKEKLFNSGIESVGSSPEDFVTAIKLDSARADKVIKFAGIGTK
jgi:tripartite-type tricarboxylate transporter receptor subunit TctC